MTRLLLALPLLLWSAPALCAIAFVAAATATPGNIANVTVNKPVGTVAGNVMVACISSGAIPNGIPSPFAYATGVQGTSCATFSSITNACVYTGVYASGASFQWTFAANDFPAASIASYSGVNTTTPVDTGVNSASGASTAFSVSYGATTVANDLLTTCVNFQATPGTFATPPAGETARSTLPYGSGNNYGQWFGEQVLGVPGSGTVTGTASQASWAGVNIPLIPSAAVGQGVLLNVGQNISLSFTKLALDLTLQP